MRPLQLLMCFGKALVRRAGNVLGFGVAGDVVVDVGEEVWEEWNRDRDEQQRRDELAALVQMAAAEFHRQVAEVLREVAAGQPEPVRQDVSRCLEEIPNKLRWSLRRPADQSGQTVPPELPLRQARDLLSLLSGTACTTFAPAALPPPARVTLTIANGPNRGRTFVFEERTCCIVGRLDGCQPRFPDDREHVTISRHHCLLDVNPPDICVRDLGSKYGTYVNGKLLDRRPEDMDRDEALKQRFRECALKDGDELQLCEQGTVLFRVRVAVPTLCADCGAWIPDDSKAGCARGPGVYQCPACRAKMATLARPRPLRACALCGRDVASETGADRPGQFLCAACRRDPGQLVQNLQREADLGASDLAALRGYTLLRKLGQGGMGAVWLARHEDSGRQVAVKVLLPQVAANQGAVLYFLRELATTRILNHPNVVRFAEAGYARGTFFLTLDYCDGGSVADLLKERGGTLPVDEALDVTRQALEGLHYAHNVFGAGSGLVHRDLKPANLFLSGSGSGRTVKVGDYGLAKAFDEAGLSGLTRTGDKAGTPRFMPRQQVLDFKYARPEVDVWALAASLYHMLTGAVPRAFPPGRSPWRVVLETAPVPIRDRNPALPDRLAAVIDRALVDDPEIPFQTAAAFQEALGSVL